MITLAAPDTSRLLVLVGLVIGAIFIATVIIMVVRKKVLSAEKAPTTGLLMEDFRRLHASGQLSDEEFQALRTRMAAKMKASMPTKGTVHDEPPPRAPQRKPAQLQKPQRSPPRSPRPPSPPPPPSPPSPE